MVGAQCVTDAATKSNQQQEVKDFIKNLESNVFDVTAENEGIALSREARKEDENFPVPLREQLRLERFLVGLDSLELFLTIRTPLISGGDRFALIEQIIEARNVANFFEEFRQYGAVTQVARDFFGALRHVVEWL